MYFTDPTKIELDGIKRQKLIGMSSVRKDWFP